ncbi:MAG TPA: N-acetylmuramoyl-L-alanine amidase [Holophaga sp.]|nr:N-acetylmuramoyl-L-alanine amidase [Holophaga sp.]
MGGLRVLAFAAPAALVALAAPGTAEVRAKLPGGGHARIQLVFRQGVQVEAAHLPKRILAERSGAWAPFQELTPEGKVWALKALFPEDRWLVSGVRHQVRWPELESVWLMSALFVGHGQHYDKLQAANPGSPEKLRAGDTWVVPRALLSRELGGTGEIRVDRSQPEDDLEDEARVGAYRALLTFQEDAQGRYAAYRMRKGETLYSSVVMRYTDRVDPKGVNDLALVIARRSGIADVRGIQPGQQVRIPVEYLADPFQPEGTTALAEEREVRAEVRRTSRVDAGPKLKGLRIVLDAGHGGVDKGAAANGVWESDFVYDIAMRVRRILERDTDAVVSSTIRYPGLGFNVREAIKAPSSQAEILTTPPFANDGESPTAVSVHLRWVLANDLFSSFARTGDARKTLFISFHADSLHPTARGTMVYVPGATGVPASFALGDRRAARVKEMREGSRVRFSPRERLQGEARSRLFSEALLRALREDEVPVHANRPIRNVIQRAGKAYVPAVIRYNVAAAKVLVEVVNLTNEEDVENLKDPVFRERYAGAVVKAIRATYRS